MKEFIVTFVESQAAQVKVVAGTRAEARYLAQKHLPGLKWEKISLIVRNVKQIREANEIHK